MVNEIHPEDTLVVRKKYTDDKWYWQYKDPGVVGIDEKNDNGPYETRAKALKAAYRFEKPKKVSNKDAINTMIGLALVCWFIGGIAVFGFGYTLLAWGFIFMAITVYGIYRVRQKKTEG